MTPAYGGLVPRKPWEFHHHFEGPLSSLCVICGRSWSEQCRGPKADEWEARMELRLALKESIFALIYGANVPAEKREQAAAGMAAFNAETLRLFPDRFREPTEEEQQRWAEMEALLTKLASPVEYTAAEVLGDIRRLQGRPLHEARHLTALPPIQDEEA